MNSAGLKGLSAFEEYAMRLARFISTLLAVLATILGTSAYAYDWGAAGNVTMIEGTYVPDAVTFTIDVDSGNCTAGSLLRWNAKGTDLQSRIANVQAVMTLLLTARTTGKRIQIYGNNSGCTVDFIHLL